MEGQEGIRGGDHILEYRWKRLVNSFFLVGTIAWL